LGPGQITGAQQNDHSVARALEHRHFAKLRKIVDFGMRARVGREKHPFVEDNAYAIGHFRFPLNLRHGLDLAAMIGAG
jgi:hypothetical protein